MTILETVELGVMSTNVVWIAPSASDLSGIVILADRSHAPGQLFPIGVTVVTYTFADGSGNMNSCIFNVIVTTGLLLSFSVLMMIKPF